MEREQILKALEHCINWNKETGCEGCPYDADCLEGQILEDSLSLIKELTEENERLRAQNDYLVKEAVFSPMERAHNTLAVRADTVRKMQERLDKHFCHDPAFLGVEQRLIMDVIDQIAKEMLEENNEN